MSIPLVVGWIDTSLRTLWAVLQGRDRWNQADTAKKGNGLDPDLVEAPALDAL